jgi:hypothetical protein
MIYSTMSEYLMSEVASGIRNHLDNGHPFEGFYFVPTHSMNDIGKDMQCRWQFCACSYIPSHSLHKIL